MSLRGAVMVHDSGRGLAPPGQGSGSAARRAAPGATPGGEGKAVSVAAIIVNYNAGPALAAAVRSLAASTVPVEVHVVDNASTDGSLDALEAVSDAGAPVRIWRNAANEGFARACNRPLAVIDADFVLLLNPDCTVAPDALEHLLAAMAGAPATGIAGPLLLNPDGSEQRGGRRRFPTPASALAGLPGAGLIMGAREGFNLQGTPLPAAPEPVEAISGACMLVRRAALDAVGPLDEGYFMHCEDLDWCMRFRRAGWEIRFSPAARVIHEQGVCSRRRPVAVEWHKHRGMLRFYRKFYRERYPAPLLWLVAAGVWLRFGLVAARHRLRRRPPPAGGT